MRYLALYRKYRPTNFSDVYGQDKVINVLKNEIVNDKISHAYLFSGPRGTGKTTTAKIIAKMVNCLNLKDGEPCNECSNCLNFSSNSDIVEIDAASNNGVDEIRELRDKVNLVPTNSKYKVYIIDEVHMLTTQAFNALLKTLEEPPSHVIFILATTEPYKVPLTVASRCQKFQFSKISNDEIVRRLEFIVNSENLSVDKEILIEIARLSDGGLRDAINMLDQLLSYRKDNITLDDVYDINGSVSYVDLYNVIINILNNNVVDLINFVEKIDSQGKSISKFIEELIVFLKDILIYKNIESYNFDIVDKTEKVKTLSLKLTNDNIYMMISQLNKVLNDIKISNNSLILFIVSLLKIINIIGNNDNEIIKNKSASKKIDNDNIIDDKEEIKEKLDNVEKLPNKDLKSFVDIRLNNIFATANKNSLINIKNKWETINDYLLDKKYATNCGILKDTIVVAASENYLLLVSKFDSVVEKINLKSEELEDTLYYIFENNYKILALSEKNWNVSKKEYISNIKSGKKYIEKEEIKESKDSMIKTPVDELIDIIGEDLIEIK